MHLPGVDDWTRPHLASSALVVIDVQADFLDGGAAPIAGTSAVLPALSALAEAFRDAGRPIFHVVRLYDGGDVDLVRRAAVAAGRGPVPPGGDGAEVPAELLGRPVRLDAEVLLAGGVQAVGPAEWLLWKPRWSAFHRTDLDVRLRQLGVDTVVVAGCNLPNCPRATIFDATSRDYRVVMVSDGLSRVTAERWHDLLGIGAIGATASEIVDELVQLTEGAA
ncbi:isochorismatase family cysteine hydrolase [Micropruina sonneratiae]|uniref:isochorismatase family cysteine hydrolase n=1 Tax=Micropruina sonneratiae TaxID=2986940 RepID=UPI002225EB24|nr:isochorismatase family cysteine hydrolase [Micropruina sp. KQZ13P-5]MCW3157248.1 cysteine hydrolase [Micropruina sp. KQZ13P-5]